MCFSLVKTRGDIVQDDIDEVIVSYLSIAVESIDIVQAFLHSPCLLEVTDLVKHPVQLTMVSIVLPNGILNLFPSSIPMPICFPLFQCFSFCTETNVYKSLWLIAGLGDGEVVIHLENPSLWIFHVTTEFCRW